MQIIKFRTVNGAIGPAVKSPRSLHQGETVILNGREHKVDKLGYSEMSGWQDADGLIKNAMLTHVYVSPIDPAAVLAPLSFTL